MGARWPNEEVTPWPRARRRSANRLGYRYGGRGAAAALQRTEGFERTKQSQRRVQGWAKVGGIGERGLWKRDEMRVKASQGKAKAGTMRCEAMGGSIRDASGDVV